MWVSMHSTTKNSHPYRKHLKKKKKRAQAWSLRVGICTQTTSPSCWSHRKAVLVLPWPAWLCKAFSTLLLAPAHTQLYSGTDEGPPQRPSQRSICKTAPTIWKQVQKKSKKPSLSFFSSILCMLSVFAKYLSLQNPSVFHSLTKTSMVVMEEQLTTECLTPR